MPASKKNRLKAAVIQTGSVLFDAPASLQKADRWIRRAAARGAGLVVMPEAFIPGYPRGMSFGAVIGKRHQWGREQYRQYYQNSLSLEGPEIRGLKKLAAELKIFLALGISEREETVHKSLYCTLLYIGPRGTILGRHRKIKPTATERTIWGEGNSHLFPVISTPAGRMGGLICWENHMPLARMALYRQGIDIYLAPTADCRPSWQHTLRHIARESRCYVLGANQWITAKDLPRELMNQTGVSPEDLTCTGGSVILSPLGEILAGPLTDGEGILTATLDPDQVIRARFDFDPAGHYQRPDLFSFSWKTGATD